MADYVSSLTGPAIDAALADMASHTSEAWAVGERNDIPVSSGDVTYHNNAKYWALQAQTAAQGENLIYDMGTTGTHNDVVFTNNGDGTWTVNGTANGTAYRSLYMASNTMPDGFEVGKTYYVYMTSTGTTVRFRVYYYINGTLDTTPKIELNGADLGIIGSFTIPANTTGMIIRYYVIDEDSANNVVVSTEVTTTPSNNYLYELNKVRVGIRTMYLTSSGWDIYSSRTPSAWTTFGSLSTFTNTFPNLINRSAVTKLGGDGEDGAALVIQRSPLAAAVGSKLNGVETMATVKLTSYANRIAFFGDSIMWGRDGNGGSSDQVTDTIPKIVAKNLGVRADNFSEGGMGYKHSSDNTHTIAYDLISSTDLTNYDTVVICFGTNDGFWTPGDWDSTSEATCLGQFNKIIGYLKTNYPTKRIIVVAPFNGSNAGSYPDYWYGTPGGSAYSRKTLSDNLKQACQYYWLPYIEQYDGPVNALNITTALPDGVHPSVDFYKKIGMWLSGEIARLIG